MTDLKRDIGQEILDGLKEMKASGSASQNLNLEWITSWDEEANRREQRIVRGAAPWVSGTDVIARMRKKIT